MLSRIVRRVAGRAAAATLGASFAAPVFCESPPESLATARPATVCTFKGADGLEENPSITLEYFALRGFGELPRLVLEVTGTPYHSVFHFGEFAFKKYAPFGQLPILHDSGLLLVESGAIVRHLARRTCIDGASMEEKAKVDMFVPAAWRLYTQVLFVLDNE